MWFDYLQITTEFLLESVQGWCTKAILSETNCTDMYRSWKKDKWKKHNSIHKNGMVKNEQLKSMRSNESYVRWKHSGESAIKIECVSVHNY